jgi:hypothetical protein
MHMARNRLPASIDAHPPRYSGPMPLDGAIDLHANHSVVVFRNEQGQVID